VRFEPIAINPAGESMNAVAAQLEKKEISCWKCGLDLVLADDVCEKCGSPQSAPESADLFEFLGVLPTLNQDSDKLQQVFHARSRKLHPDRFQKAGEPALSNSMARSALLNKAYRTLREFDSRTAYLLESERELLGINNSKAGERNVPVELAEEYFEMQEALSEGDAGVLEKIKSRIGELKAENEVTLKSLAARWDKEGLGGARARGEASEGRRKFAKDLEKALQMKSYLFRMEEDAGRVSTGGPLRD